MHIILTGAATGIGAEVAKKLLARGNEVTALDISQPASGMRWIETDMGDPASINRALEQLDGPYHALINNAGLPPKDGLSAKILSVNFLGLRQLTEGVIPMLAPDASIVNTASRAGAAWRENIEEVNALFATDHSALQDLVDARGIDPTRAYNLSKEAVIFWTMAKTEPLIPLGLRMNAVSPAATATKILDDFKQAFGDKVAHNVALTGRPAEPSEVADLIVFLASPQSHWIKGQDIVIDGGMTAIATAKALAT